jgi:RNA polymerase-associated protein LEO1
MSQGGSPSSSQVSPSKSQGLTYLVAQHKHSQVLQAEAVITGHMTIQPTGMQSDTHRMLVRAVGQKHNKVARLRMAPDPTVDPEREKMELMKQSAKKAKKAEGDESGRRRKRTGSARKRAGHDVWSDDDDEFAASGADNETGTDGTPRRKKKAADHKRAVGEYQEDDFLVADSTDEDGEDDTGRTKARDGEPEEDRLDEKIKEERRQNRDSGGGTDGDESDEDKGGEEEMDVESEEGEEDFRVRRSGPSGRKRRAIDLEEEDDE